MNSDFMVDRSSASDDDVLNEFSESSADISHASKERANDVDLALQSIKDAYDDTRYPEAFVSTYAIMECLAEHQGADTFLVQDADGNRFVAKCFDTNAWSLPDDEVLNGVNHEGVPKTVAVFDEGDTAVIVREHAEGVPLDRYAREHGLSEGEIVRICLQICDILAYLHHRGEPIIHRDIKPQNVVVRPDGKVALIDFDIARVYREGNDTDTRFFGTLAYAPPEQYGFSQTDARADIYSLGVLLRYLITGSPRENKNVRVSKPLDKIIRKCTAFSPNDRYSDVLQVKRALDHANPSYQRKLRAGGAIAAVLVLGLALFGGVKLYESATYSPFKGDHVAAIVIDEGKVADAVSYLQKKYGTHLFDNTDDVATVGLMRRSLIELYGLDRDYVYAHQDDGLPGESDEYFMAWGWDDTQNLDRDYAMYAVLKAHDPKLVAEDTWTVLKDDTGEYPGARVAALFAEQHGIFEGTGRPKDITTGELAIICANTDKAFA